MNGDGIPDAIVAGDSELNILLGSGDGLFQSSSPAVSLLGTATAIRVGDVNHDGLSDIIVTTSAENQIEYSVSASFGRLATGDLNGDGKLDLAIVGFYNDLMSLVFGTGDPTTLHVVSYPAKTESAAIAVVDVNGDSRPDIIFAGALPDTVSVLPATCLP